MDKHKLFRTPHTQIPLTGGLELTKRLTDPAELPATAPVPTKQVWQLQQQAREAQGRQRSQNTQRVAFGAPRSTGCAQGNSSVSSLSTKWGRSLSLESHTWMG